MSTYIFLLITIAILSGTGSRLIAKHVLKNNEPYAFSLLSNFIETTIFFILAFPFFTLPSNPTAWLFVVFSGVFWSASSVCFYTSYKTGDISLRDPLSQSKIIFTLILGILVLGEQPSTYRILGNLLVFFGVCLLVYKPGKTLKLSSDPGLKFAFLAAFLSSVASVLDKSALKFFDVMVYAGFACLFTTLFLSLFIRKRTHHVKKLIKNHWKPTLLSIILNTSCYYFILKVISQTDITFAYPLLQFSTLLIALGGIIILKERQNIPQKIVASILIIVASYLVNL